MVGPLLLSALVLPNHKETLQSRRGSTKHSISDTCSTQSFYSCSERDFSHTRKSSNLQRSSKHVPATTSKLNAVMNFKNFFNLKYVFPTFNSSKAYN